MSIAVFAAPAPAEPTGTVQRYEYTHLWTGVDGASWDLSAGNDGVKLQAGVVGLGHTSSERWVDESPGVPGSMFHGARPQALSVQLPVVMSTRLLDVPWRELVRRWWKGWSTRKPGTWTVTDSSGRSLCLDLRHDPSPGFSLSMDPGILPRVPWMVDAVADFPYWRGDLITRSWGAPKQLLFMGGGDPDSPVDVAAQAGPGFAPSSQSSLSEAEIDNPGGVDAYPVWTLTGPFDSVSITVAGGTFAVSAIGAGHTVVVDTAPTNAVAIQDGLDEVPLTVWDPRPVPAYETVPVTIAANGLGMVSVALTPLYEIGL